MEDLHLAASYKHNNEFGLRIAASLNTKQKTPEYPQRFYKSTLDMKKEEFPEGYNPSSWYDRLLLDMSKAGLILMSADYEIDGESVVLEVSNKDYRSWPDAISVVLRLLIFTYHKIKSIAITINEEGYRLHTLESIRPRNIHNDNEETFVNQLDILLPREIKSLF